MQTRPRYVRHRKLERLRHSTWFHKWLEAQMARLSLTKRYIFDMLLNQRGYTFEQIEGMTNVTPSPVPENAPPMMRVRPYITTDVIQGARVECNPGEWISEGPVTFRYRWMLVYPDGTVTTGSWGDSNATTMTYPGQRTIWWEVEATNEHGSTIGATRKVPIHEPGEHAVPVNTSLPTVSGNYLTDNILFAEDGEWEGPVSRVRFLWKDATTGDYITSASNPTLFLDNSMVGKTIQCEVEAITANGSAKALSAPGGPVELQTNPPNITKTPRYLTVPGGLQCVIEEEPGITYDFQWKLNGVAYGPRGNQLIFEPWMYYNQAECRVIFTNAQGQVGSVLGASYYIRP